MTTYTLHDLCEQIFTGLPPRLKAEPPAIRLQVVGIRSVTTDGLLNLANLEEFHVTGTSPNLTRSLLKGDVLLTIRGSLPKCALVQDGFAEKTFASGNLAVLRPNQSCLDSGYLWSFLTSICSHQSHPLLMRASTQQLSIRMADLSKLEIPCPPLEDQKTIGRTVLALREALISQREAQVQGERTFNAFLADIFPNHE